MGHMILLRFENYRNAGNVAGQGYFSRHADAALALKPSLISSSLARYIHE